MRQALLLATIALTIMAVGAKDKELPVDRNGFVGPIPEISAMVPYDNFDVFSARDESLYRSLLA